MAIFFIVLHQHAHCPEDSCVVLVTHIPMKIRNDLLQLHFALFICFCFWGVGGWGGGINKYQLFDFTDLGVFAVTDVHSIPSCHNFIR